jgi:hypothetical protein
VKFRSSAMWPTLPPPKASDTGAAPAATSAKRVRVEGREQGPRKGDRPIPRPAAPPPRRPAAPAHFMKDPLTERRLSHYG